MRHASVDKGGFESGGGTHSSFLFVLPPADKLTRHRNDKISDGERGERGEV